VLRPCPQSNRLIGQLGAQVDPAVTSPLTAERIHDVAADLIAVPADGRAQVQSQRSGSCAEGRLERPNSPRQNASRHATPPGVKESHGSRVRIQDVYGNAVGRGHRQKQARSATCQPVRLSRHVDPARRRLIEAHHAGAVHLPGDRRSGQAEQPRQLLIARQNGPGGGMALEPEVRLPILLRAISSPAACCHPGRETREPRFPLFVPKECEAARARASLGDDASDRLSMRRLQQGTSTRSIIAPIARRRSSMRS
jgi:hypothetical protein